LVVFAAGEPERDLAGRQGFQQLLAARRCGGGYWLEQLVARKCLQRGRLSVSFGHQAVAENQPDEQTKPHDTK
jgi:hypothetical protein